MYPRRTFPQSLGHRQIAMIVIGRSIEKWEQVHHIDEDHRNDDPDNLLVLPSTTHLLIHGKKVAPRWMRYGFAWLAPRGHRSPRPHESLVMQAFSKWIANNPWAFAWFYNEPSVIEFPDGTRQILG